MGVISAMGKQNTSHWCSPVMLIFGILTAYFAYYSFTGRDPLNAESGLQGLTGIIKRWDGSGSDFLDGVIVGGGTEPEDDGRPLLHMYRANRPLSLNKTRTSPSPLR